ncbi:HK97 family phage prohead protease [Acidaminococcus fermentans]|uniref:HK97 family phage prohead protease n=1 Tax=Acidaminococcus TaxID=904 RepID=UPI00242FFE2B|nr:HK97 family phage prohead protease [Acidaminococcus fermentans]
MTNRVEIRNVEIRAADGGGEELHVEGYAAVFQQRTLLWESPFSGTKYYEIIAPEAVDSRTDMSDVILRYNHSDAALILARSSNGTLTVTPDETGLKISAKIAPTTAGKDIYQLIKRGDISKMSFAFAVDKDEWENDQANKTQTRTIRHISMVYDVSPVDVPAYDGTSITARNGQSVVDELKEREAQEKLRQKLIVQTYL